MKKFAALFLVTFAAACGSFKNSAATADVANDAFMNANKIRAVNANASPTIASGEKNAATKYPIVWLGQAAAENGKLTLMENVVWSFDEEYADEKEQRLYPASETYREFEADVLNCAGYLGSVKITRSGAGEDWRVELMASAADGERKIKQCGSPLSDGKIIGAAFAIAPSSKARQTITIEKIDTRKLFASLPKDVKDFLNSKYAVAAGRKKDELSLLQNDYWTDTDGDGKIDLLYYSAAYDEEHSSGGILYLSGNQWTEIGAVRD